MNHVREAAERLRRHELRNPNHAECPDHWQDCNAARAFVIDMLCEEAITPAALEALGFEVNYGIWSLSVASIRLQVIVDNDRVLVNIWDCGHQCRTDITTIGQLRALIFALSPKGTE